MAQLDPSRYKRLTKPYAYASSDGLYWDGTNSRLVVSINGTVYEAPLHIASQARGDVLRRGASTWERAASVAAGSIAVGNGTDSVPVVPTGDVTIDGSGATAIGANKVLSAMVDPNLIKYAVVDMTNAQVGALNTTAITVVPAPSAGFFHIVDSVVFYQKYGSAVFTGVGANDNLVLRYENASGTIATGSAAGVGMFDQASDQARYLLPIACTPVAAKALVVAMAASADGLTGGGTGTVVRAAVAYRTHQTP